MESTIFRKIMVATDGSELVKRAVDLAIEIAKLSKAKLYAVYVIDLGIINRKIIPKQEVRKQQLMSRKSVELQTLRSNP